MDETRQAVGRHSEATGGLVELARQIALGWADKLGVGADTLEWVAIAGAARERVSALGLPPVHCLEGAGGVAFILAAPGASDLLFVVRGRGVPYWVSISNNARPWDAGERHSVRAGFVGDMKLLLAAIARYARRAAT